MGEIKVYEIRLKVYLLRDISKEQTYAVLADYIDSCLAESEELSKLHKKNCYKCYSFDQPYPIEKDGIYKKDRVYTVRIRTVNDELADYFAGKLANHYNKEIKGLTREVRVIPKKHISQIYTVTPALVKCNGGGYWRDKIKFEEYEQLLKNNLIKKYNFITGEKIDENFELYRQIELVNRVPVKVPYKNINWLTDKLSIEVEDNEVAQTLFYMAIATGICEANARGFGFVNYKFA